MAKIIRVTASEILDSRGNPTVAAEVILDNGVRATSMVPSGASTGSREALELRDHDPRRYKGKGVLKAVANVNGPINECLVNQDPSQQAAIDNLLINLDGTENKEKLGANAILAASMAVASAAAKSSDQALYQYLSEGKEYILPTPMMNVINGGAHADNQLDIQEFMILPVGAANFAEGLRYGAEVFHALKSVLRKRGLNTGVGDEGGFAPDLPSNEVALEVILAAIQEVGLTAGKDIVLGLDVASTELFKNGQYVLAAENKTLSPEEFVAYQENLVRNYPIVTIEDGMAEDDWAGWKLMTERLGQQIQLVGDDLFVTNAKTLKVGIEKKIANAILIKLNQIGTVTETLAAIQTAQAAGYGTIISHRSGETEDTFIADLAVAVNAGQIKTGSLCRSDRVAKYNRLLIIEAELGAQAKYSGWRPYKK